MKNQNSGFMIMPIKINHLTHHYIKKLLKKPLKIKLKTVNDLSIGTYCIVNIEMEKIVGKCIMKMSCN